MTIFRFFLFLCVFLFPSSLFAQQFGIIAIVNGQAISNVAVKERVEIAITSSGLENKAEIRRQILPQILQSLINEALQKQDAEKAGIEVTESNMTQAIADLEKQNGLAPGGFDGFVAAQQIDKEALLEQIRAQIRWKKIVSARIRPRIKISDGDITDAMKRINKTDASTVMEVDISEIFLPVDGSQKENETRILAKKLAEEIRSGKEFEAIAREFSKNSTATEGGRLGWIRLDQLMEPLRKAVEQTDKDTVTWPVRTERGFHILKLHDKRVAPGFVSREQVKNMLLMNQLELKTRKYMIDLRDNAFIEIRL